MGGFADGGQGAAEDRIHVFPPVQSIRSPVPELDEGRSGPHETKFAKMACCAKEAEYTDQIRSICTCF